ncbi:MAG: hypothetical protein ABIP94_16405 [Planctomycetota bacterium]
MRTRTILLLPLVVVRIAAQQPDIPLPRAPSFGVEQAMEAMPVKNGPMTAAGLLPADQETTPPLSATDRRLADFARAGVASAFADPDFVAFDEPGDGPIWAVANNFKVAFEAFGWRFIPRPAPDSTELHQVAFRLESVTVDGSELSLGAPRRTRSDRHVAYAYGTVVEALDVRGVGVEQSFVIDHLPRRGELVLELATTTSLHGETTSDGIHFRGPFADVHYAQAVAIEGNGARVVVPTTFANGHVTIRVPGDFVAHAAMPLVIDPLVSSIAVYNSTNDVGDPDIAWDETGQVWAVVFSRVFAPNEWDCYVQRVSLGSPGTPMTLVGGLITVDASTTSWERPRIANLGVFDVFMVTAQTHVGTALSQIGGRIVANSGSVVTGQFSVATSSVAEIRPDIGGNPGPPPAFFTVVWEHSTSASNHDIYARQVEATGALRGTGPILVATNSANQTFPSISKSCGSAPQATQRFGIVYQQTQAAGNEDILGSMMTYDGVLVPVLGSTVFPVNTSASNDRLPSVSSPTIQDSTGKRLMLAAYERTGLNAGDIFATCFDSAGVVRATANVSALELSPVRLTWPQYRPSVDSDGLRFAIGYHETFNGNLTTNDLDTRVTVVALQGNALMAEEAGTALGFSGNREFNLQIASRYSGSGSYSAHFNTTNDRDGIPSGGLAIDAYRFNANSVGLFTTRATGCNSASISTTGSAVPGSTFAWNLSSSPFVQGFVLGAPVSAQIGPCPACTLGVDGFLAVGASYSVAVPLDPSVVGWVVSAQGFRLDGDCVGVFSLSNTIDVTVQ